MSAQAKVKKQTPVSHQFDHFKNAHAGSQTRVTSMGACMIHTCSNESCAVVCGGRKEDKDTEGEMGQALLESQFVNFSSTHQWPTNVCQ